MGNINSVSKIIREHAFIHTYIHMFIDNYKITYIMCIQRLVLPYMYTLHCLVLVLYIVCYIIVNALSKLS